MKKATEDDFEDMPEEVNFSAGVRGKYAGLIQPVKNLVLIEPDLFESFPSAEAVNTALRILQKAGAEAVRLKDGQDHAKAS